MMFAGHRGMQREHSTMMMTSRPTGNVYVNDSNPYAYFQESVYSQRMPTSWGREFEVADQKTFAFSPLGYETDEGHALCAKANPVVDQRIPKFDSLPENYSGYTCHRKFPDPSKGFHQGMEARHSSLSPGSRSFDVINSPLTDERFPNGGGFTSDLSRQKNDQIIRRLSDVTYEISESVDMDVNVKKDEESLEAETWDSMDPTQETDAGHEIRSEDLYLDENAPKEQSYHNLVLPPCRICGAKASGFHYGVNSCEACKGFFRRALKRPVIFYCSKDKMCDVRGNRRSTCRFCRYKRCLSLGMSRSAIKTGRYSHNKRTSDTIEVKQLQNTPAFPVDEPDFDGVLQELVAAHEAQKSLASSSQSSEVTDRFHHGSMTSANYLQKAVRSESSESDLPEAKLGDSSRLTTPIGHFDDSLTFDLKQKDSPCQHCHGNRAACFCLQYASVQVSSPSLSSSSADSGYNDDNASASDDGDRSTKSSPFFPPEGALDLSVRAGRAPGHHARAIHSSSPQRIGERSQRPEAWHPSSDGLPSHSPRAATPRHPVDMPGVTKDDSAWDVDLHGRDARPRKRSIDQCDLPSHKFPPKRPRLHDDVGDGLDLYTNLNLDLTRTGNSPANVTARACDKQPEGGDFHAVQRSNSSQSTIIDSDCDDVAVISDDDIESDIMENPQTSESTVKAHSHQYDHGFDSIVKSPTALAAKDGTSESSSNLRNSTNTGSESAGAMSLKRAERWVAEYISFAKSIPGFVDLSAEAVGVLLRQAWDEVWMLQAFSGFNDAQGLVVMPSGKRFHRDDVIREWGPAYAQVAFDVAAVLQKHKFTPEVLVVLKAICIISPDRCPASCREKGEQVHWFLVSCLLKYLDTATPTPRLTLPRLVAVLTSLRDLSEVAGRSVHRGHLDQSFGGALFPDPS